MEAKKNLYYALGLLAYAVAKADGKVQNEEREIIHNIVKKESGHHIDFDYAEIIFNILQKDNPGADQVYSWSMNAFKTGKQHFTPLMKEQFVAIIKKVAEAFPPSTIEEQNIIDKFSREIWVTKINEA